MTNAPFEAQTMCVRLMPVAELLLHRRHGDSILNWGQYPIPQIGLTDCGVMAEELWQLKQCSSRGSGLGLVFSAN